MKDYYGVIYKITNLNNGKLYIGQTITSLKKRWQRHMWSCTKKNPRMAITHAIIKYGDDCFKMEELCKCFSMDELNELETYYIKKYNTLSPNGYNLNTGGNHREMSDETKKKIQKSNTGKKFTIAHRKKLSESHIGQTISEKERQRRRDFMKGKQPNELARKNSIKSIIKKYEIIDPCGNIFIIENMAKFCREYNLLNSCLCNVAKGKSEHHKGYKAKQIG